MKKILSIILSLMMISSSITALAAVSAPDLSSEVLQAKADEETISGTKQNFFQYNQAWVNSSNELVLSFDVKLSQTDKAVPIDLRSEIEGDASQYNNAIYVAYVTFDDTGRVAFSKNGWGLWGLNTNSETESNTATTTYQANKWYNVAAVMHPAGADTTIDWYFDNQLITTANVSDISNKDKIAGPAYSIVYQPVSGAEITVKNFKAANASVNSKFYAASAALDNSSVVVEFNEPVVADTITSLDVISPDGISVKGTGYTLSGRKLSIPVTDAKNAGEYTVVFNDGIKSVSGKSIGNDTIIFELSGTASGKTAPDFDTAAILIDWNTKTTGSLNATFNDGNIGVQNGGIAGAEWVKVDDAHGTSLKIVDTTSNPVLKLRSLKKDFPFGWSNYAFADGQKMVLEFDFYVSENQKRTPTLIAQGSSLTNSPSIGCFLDSYGNFVAIGKNATSMDNPIITEDKQTGAYSKGYERYPITSGWHHLAIEWNKATREINYYVDNTLAVEGKDYISSDVSNAKQSVVNLGEFFAFRNLGGSGQGAWIIDNLQVNFRYANDELLSAVASNKTDAAINYVKTEYGSAPVTKSVSTSYVNGADYMLSTKIQLTEKPENGEMNFYIMNKDGKHLHSGMFYGADKFGLVWDEKSDASRPVYPAYDSARTGAIYPSAGGGSSFPSITNGFNTQSDKIVTIDAYYDASAKKMFVYADGTLIGEQDFTAVPGLFTEANYNDYIPAMISIGELRNSDGTSLLAAGESITGKIGDMTLYQVCDAKIEKVLVNTADDVYSVYSNGITVDVKNIDLYSDIAISSADAILKNSAGASIPVTVGAYDSTDKNIKVTVTQGFLPADTYTLTLSDIVATDATKVIAPATVSFSVNGADKAVVTKLEVKNDGTLYYIDGAAENYTAKDQNVTFILAEYSNNGTKLENVDFVTLTLKAGNVATINNTTDVKVSLTPASGNSLSAFAWDDFEHATPYVAKVDAN